MGSTYTNHIQITKVDGSPIDDTDVKTIEKSLEKTLNIMSDLNEDSVDDTLSILDCVGEHENEIIFSPTDIVIISNTYYENYFYMIFSLKYCLLNMYQKEFQKFLGKRYTLNIITYDINIESNLDGKFHKQSSELFSKNLVLTDGLLKIINCEDTSDTTLQSIVEITTDKRLLIPIMKHKNVSDTTLELLLNPTVN